MWNKSKTPCTKIRTVRSEGGGLIEYPAGLIRSLLGNKRSGPAPLGLNDGLSDSISKLIEVYFLLYYWLGGTIANS